MRREEKRRRFNEVNMLFPQPPPPPQVLWEEEEENEPVNVLRENFDMDLIPGFNMRTIFIYKLFAISNFTN